MRHCRAISLRKASGNRRAGKNEHLAAIRACCYNND